MKIILKRFVITLSLLIFAIIVTNIWVIQSTINKTFNNIKDIPAKNVGLILGANKYTSNGAINLYYKYRLEAALKLYHASKINYLIISGDTSSKGYNEPNMFKDDLIRNGVPEENIFLDFAGFRTLDSVIRAKDIFEQTELTIISQEFHNERAIYLAQNHSLDAIGFNAKNVSKHNGLKTNVREYFAKTKAVLDILIGVKAKFLGDKISIPHV